MGSIPEEYREVRFSLGSTEREGQPQFRAFAEPLLEFLIGTGLPEIDKLRRAPEGNAGAPDPKADEGPYDPDLRRATLENGQTVYAHLNAGRSRHGHKELAVLTRQQAEERWIASRAERAIVAATTAMEYVRIDTHRLRRALNQMDGPITTSAEEYRSETAQKMLRIERSSGDPQRRRENAQRAVELQDNLQTPSLEYVLALLRYSRPGFDALPPDEQVGLILVASEYLNGFLDSLRKLMAFLEYGSSEDGVPTNIVKKLNRDVQATLLSELTDLRHRTIGKELDIPPPPSSEIKGGHDTVRHMIKRGRTFLTGLLGDDEWQEHLTRMKVDARRYQTLSKEERIVEDHAETWNEPKEVARERLERRRRQFRDVPSGLSGIPEEQLLDHLRNLDQKPPT